MRLARILRFLCFVSHRASLLTLFRYGHWLLVSILVVCGCFFVRPLTSVYLCLGALGRWWGVAHGAGCVEAVDVLVSDGDGGW